MNMTKEELPELPEELEKYVEKPYGGLFGDNVQIRIIEEIVADPYRLYRPKHFEELTGGSQPSIRKALNSLTSLGLLEKDSTDKQHPIYRPNLKSRRIAAMTFLSLASIDDRDKTDCMDMAIADYYMTEIKEKLQPSVIATAIKWELNGQTWGEVFVAEPGQSNKETIEVIRRGA